LEELGVLPEDSIDDAKKKLPPIKHFLNDETTDELFLSEKVLEKSAAWCLDVVKPHDARSACFTSSYGKFLRGTGSVLYVGQRSARTFALEAPEQRQFDANWAAGLSCTDLRHFSGVEIALLLGFPPSFRFPAHVTVKQQWKLLGNSLSVRVAAVVVEFGLRVLWNAHPAAER
jgi:tRNA (cytosine38-C5)-methyltransferase